MPATSPSPSPPPTAPQTTHQPSHRFTALKRIHTDFIRQSLKQNSYENFASCFPTPATYCPSALEGVWKQLNSRLEEECLKDFEKLCEEREVEEGLRSWEVLVEDAKRRKQESDAKGGDSDSGNTGDKAMHELTAAELYQAHAASGLMRAEKELVGKLAGLQEGNKEMSGKIEAQREEMRRLVEVLEGLVADLEGAAGVVEVDEMREEIQRGAGVTAGVDASADVKMGG